MVGCRGRVVSLEVGGCGSCKVKRKGVVAGRLRVHPVLLEEIELAAAGALPVLEGVLEGERVRFPAKAHAGHDVPKLPGGIP